ncbi:MAG TPA: FHA domain-containing protein, partial [Verrucomicrobiae bacterium]
MARFIVSPDTPDSWAIPLKTGVNTVGRGDGNDAVINHPSISGRHCEIVVSADVVRLKDLGSTNGTFINRAPVTEAILQPGQRIQLGAVELLFEADATTPAPRTPIAIRVRPQPVPTAMALPASDGLALAGQPHAPPPAAGGWESASSAAEGPPVREATDPGHALCKYHPRTSAHWLCPNCHKTYCDLCVATRPGAVTQRFCKSCGAVCTELQVRIEIPAQKSFFRELPRSILYPFRGTGILILLVATVLFAALDFLSRGLIGLLMKAVA